MRRRGNGESLVRRTLILSVVTAVVLVGLMPVLALATPGQMMWWEIKKPMPVAGRSRAVGEIGGLLYVVGGTGMTTRVDVYDPSSDTWTTPTYTLTNPLQSNAVGVRAGVMYVVTDTQVIGFDPLRVGSKDWVVATLALPTDGARADIWNDTIYVTGGSDWIQAVDLDILGQTGTGRIVTQIPYWLKWAPTFAANGSLYVCGGKLSSPTYTDLGWRMPINAGHGMEGVVQATAAFPLARLGQSPQPFSNGKWYLATGKPYVDTMEFDPGVPSWTVIGSVPTPRFSASVESYQDKLITIGGADEFNVDTNVTEVGHLENCADIYADAHGTPAGGGTVQVTVDGYPVSVTFPAGTTEGPFTCAVMNSAPHGYPAGFQTNGKVFELASGSGNIVWPVTITLPYTGSVNNPSVLHYNGTNWDKTDDWDNHTLIGNREFDVQIMAVGNGAITFKAWSMSPFVAGEVQAVAPTTSTPASSPWSLVISSLLATGMTAAGIRRNRITAG